MKVLLTHDRFLPDFAGGGESIVFETARQLAARGADVRVLTCGNPAQTSYRGIATTRLPMHSYRFNLAVRQIVRQAQDVDLIQTFTYHASLPSLVAGRVARKPVVCLVLGFFHEAWRLMRGPLVGAAYRQWERFLITRPYDRTVFLSDFSLQAGLRAGVRPERASVNPAGIDLENFRPADDKDDYVLFVGKIEERKGLDDLLEVARALPEVPFQVTGWGPERERYARQAPANVRFTSFQEGDVLRQSFSRARIFFLPSKAETLGLVVIEAMASGCAIVSTVPLDFQGVMVRPGDRDGMVKAVARLWGDRNATRQMGLENVRLSQAYTWDRYGKSLLATYDQLLGRAGACAPEQPAGSEA